MNRARWILWLLLLIAAGVLLVWFRGRVPIAAQVLDLVRAREREAALRIEEGKAGAARLRARAAKSSLEAQSARMEADLAAAKARAIGAQREEMLRRVSGRITDEERARRFNDRHGLGPGPDGRG